MTATPSPFRPAASFTVVQGLRGIAALWVVLFHASEGGHIDSLKAVLPRPMVLILFDMGHSGVPIFFALSGFVIAHSLRDVSPSFAFLGRFVARRWIRLDPPYWLSIAFVVAFGALSATVKGEPFGVPTAGTIAAHLVYLQVLLGTPTISSVYWTLTYEVQFYLFFATMLVVAQLLSQRDRWSFVWRAVWVAMFALALASAIDLVGWLPKGLFTALWAAFFVGVVAYHAVGYTVARIALTVLVLVMLLSPGAESVGFFAISATTAVLLWGSAMRGWIESGLRWRWLQFLGTISYSLYLLHNPLSGAVGFAVRQIAGRGVAADLVSLAMILSVSTAVAAAFWWGIERPAHHWSKRVRLARKTS